MARFDRSDVVPTIVATIVFVSLLLGLWFWLMGYSSDHASAASGDSVSTFDHSNCQYPDRWSNTPTGCDNSDPAVPECLKSAWSQESEKACIDDFTARYNQKDESIPVSSSAGAPVASQAVNCAESQ